MQLMQDVFLVVSAQKPAMTSMDFCNSSISSLDAVCAGYKLDLKQLV
jgi:hypothetical protein